MNKHLNEGELRAALDDELDNALLGHLNACPACQTQLSELKQAHLRIAKQLSFLSTKSEAIPSAQSAWYRFTQDYMNQKETSMLKKWFAFPVVRVGAIVILALALLLAFPSTRALASDLLNLFRVQQVTVLPIDAAGLENMTGNETLGSQLSELVSSSTVVTDEPGEPVPAANAEEASAAAGFTVRLPSEPDHTGIYVTDTSGFTLTVDRAKAQALLDAAGRSDLVLPDEIDGAEVSISIPGSVITAFGTCPEPRTEKDDPDSQPDMGYLYPDCVAFSQMPSPVVSAPDNFDIAQLAQIGLQFTGMSQEEAADFAGSVDWATTLVVPIPQDAATYVDVEVDGVSGKFIQQNYGEVSDYVLIWVKDGIVYAISGTGLDTTLAFEIADSLP